MCGDFNSKPDGSVIHNIMNKAYLLTESRTNSETGVKAYRTEEGQRLLKLV